MCIRDSSYRGYPIEQLAEKSTFLEVSYLLLNGNLPNKKHCLLYTSDAADERSSVDLGGRRIIKKKNRAHRSMRRNTNVQNYTKNYHTTRKLNTEEDER